MNRFAAPGSYGGYRPAIDNIIDSADERSAFRREEGYELRNLL
jgi:hypothetical protein